MAASSKLFQITPEIRTLICRRADGFNPGSEKPAKGLIKKVTDKSGDSGAGKPYIADATRNFKKVEGAQGFKIVMDADSGSIMVTGTNGGLYLVGKDKGYDVSAPWGTLDTIAKPLTLDVFGRVLSYKLLKSYKKRGGYIDLGQDAPMLADLMVSEPKRVPVGYKAT